MKKAPQPLFFALILCTILLTGLYTMRIHSSEKKYIAAISAGGEWFLNNQNEEFLHYEYIPILKKHPGENQKLREMGALWSIAKLSHFQDDNRYKILAKKGFSYFEKSFKHDSGQDIFFVNVTPQRIKLAYNAFGILALLEMEHPKKKEYLEKLVNGIEFLQNKDGSFKTFFYSNRTGGADYYPGEALFALMSLYEKQHNQRLLRIVEKAFPYYRTYWRKNKNTGFIPWQSRAYQKLALATGKKEYEDFLFEMNDWLLERHSPKNCQDFQFKKKGITVAVFMEGVIQAYKQALNVKDETRIECYAKYIQEGADYILGLQIKNTDDKHAHGGFLGSSKISSLVEKNTPQLLQEKIDSSKKQPNFTRVDNNQHAVIALMEAYNLGLLQ